MSLRYALLGLLAEEPASGYDLTRKFERALQRYAWHAKHSQIYPELTKLAGDGLVAVVAEGARGRRTYAITDAGRAELRSWMLNPPDVFVVRNEFVLRLFLLSTLDAEDAREVLRWVADENARGAATLRDALAKAEALPLAPGRLAAEFGRRSFQITYDWAQWALNQIDRSSVPVGVRAATEADSALLLAWRNDSQTRAWSRTTDPVTRAEHETWLTRVLADPVRRLLVAELDGKPVGTVRFDRDGGAWEVSITVAPEARGRRLAVPILLAAERALAPATVRANVHRDNAASLALFERAGYRPESGDGPWRWFVKAV
jgi:DNA-binding PadR family transcriptional regulator/L-amino acid N-acyltransferase YncA